MAESRKPELGRRLPRGWLWIVALLVLAGLIYFGGIVGWICLGFVGISVAALLGLLGLGFLYRNSMVSVWSQAQRPFALLASGQRDQAERDFKIALKKAESFPTDDCRRGLMLSELARYLECWGRRREAGNLFAESLAIVEVQRNLEPFVYLICLNSFALFHLHARDLPRAQELLEKAFDWTLIAKKETAGVSASLGDYLTDMEFGLRLNLAAVFLEIPSLQEARHYLNAAEHELQLMNRHRRQVGQDVLLGQRAMWHFMANELDLAQSLCEKVQNRNIIYFRVQAKIHLARKHYKLAEETLNAIVVGGIGKTETRPELFDPFLDYAECLFAQGDYEGSFVAQQMAQTLVRYHRMPCDAAWRNTLEIWLARARELGKADLIASLEADLRNMPATVEQRITILEKFRIHPRVST